MCLLPTEGRCEEPADDFLEMMFACLAHYHHYQVTGEVEEGITVVETEGSLSFKKEGSFTDDQVVMP